MIPPAPWRVGIISQIAPVATGYAGIVRALGHEPVVHLAARRRRPDEEPTPEQRAFGAQLYAGAPPDVDFVSPATNGGVAHLLRAYDVDLVLCTAFPWRLTAEALAVPPLGVVNGHPSKLPDHRGPFPIGWQVREGATEIGMSYHLMDEQFDTGAVLAQGALPLAEDETLDTLGPKLGALSAELLPVVFERLADGDRGDEQTGGSYESAFEEEYAFVDLGRPADEVHRQVRAWAVTPPFGHREHGALLEREGGRIRLLRTSLAEVEGAERLECADGPLWLVGSEPA